jgi:hypothetical protein
MMEHPALATPRYDVAGSLPNDPPSDSPARVSRAIRGVTLTGRYATYADADTWFPSWARDGHLYSPWTDGSVGNFASNSKGVCAMTGYARVVGDDPLALRVEPLGTRLGTPGAYVGRYPGGSLVVGDHWYYSTYLVHEDRDERGQVRDLLGPLVGFSVSSDGGRTWDDGPHSPERPIFAERVGDVRPIKVGSPRFVDFGQDLRHSPDGNAYVVAFGGLEGQGHLSWILGDAVYLGRVRPSPETLNDPAAWEWFGGGKTETWSHHLADAEPIFTWPRSIGQVSCTFLPALGRFLLFVTFARLEGSPTTSYVLESTSLTGGWSMVGFWPEFGPQAYFLNVPSKFVAPDGRRAWLCYSANHSGHFAGPITFAEDPPGSRYALCLREIVLDTA